MMQDVFVKPGSPERPDSGEDTARRRSTGASYQGGNTASRQQQQHRASANAVAREKRQITGLKERKEKQMWVREMSITGLEMHSEAINSV